MAAEFPGHPGTNAIRPIDDNNLQNIIIRFDTFEHLYSWTQSDTRRVLVKEITPLLAEGDKTEIRTEVVPWFTPPALHARQPKRWEQFLTVLLVIFPSTNLVPRSTSIVLPAMKSLLLPHLTNGAFVAALMVQFWILIVTHLLAGWLKKAWPVSQETVISQTATSILTHGGVHTLDRQNPQVETVAIANGKTLATDSHERAMSFTAEGTQTVDLQGHTAIPGLSDSHLHLIYGGLSYNLELRWEDVPSLADTLRMLKDQADRTPSP